MKANNQQPAAENASTWRTVIVGLPIIRKLLAGEDVEIQSFKVNLIPDDVLWNNRAARAADASKERGT